MLRYDKRAKPRFLTLDIDRIGMATVGAGHSRRGYHACYPREGGYNWTPPITDHTASVGILSILGEDYLEAEELHF